MKGISTTLWIIIAAILALVVGLILLTMFGSSVASFASLADARNFCKNQCTISCNTLNQMPINWDANIKVGEEITTCRMLTGIDNCAECTGQNIPGGSAV